MGIFLLEDGQVILALIGVAVVNDDDFKLGIVLLQHGAQVAAQILGFLAGADDDGYGGQFWVKCVSPCFTARLRA